MTNNYNSKLKNFKSISLTELKTKASYLKRIDKKYLLNIKKFSEILEDLKEDFHVLEINWKKIFTYDNIYMDSEDYLFYNQHENKKNSRTKVRTRYYVDSNLAFFEYKQKINWIINKYRYDFPSEEHGFMTKWKKRFFDWVWQSIYNDENTPKLTPSIQTKYKRITLVSKNGWERLTIDFNIKIKDLRNKNSKEINLKNLVIIESKSLDTNYLKSEEIIKNHNIEQVKSCSKYSLWIIYSWLTKRYDTFKETIEKIKEIRWEIIKNRERKIWEIVKIWKNDRFVTKALGV